MTITHKFKRSFSNLSLSNKIILIGLMVILLAGVVAFIRLTNNTSGLKDGADALSQVQLQTIAELSGASNTTLKVTATLRNKSEEDLRFEIPGQVTHVYKPVGSFVKSGTLIAEVTNSTQRAQLTQALGSLQAAQAQARSAQAQLNKLNNGATLEDKDIIATQVSTAQNSINTAYQNARNSLQAAYSSTINIISFGSDTVMKDPTSAYPTLTFNTVQNSAKINSSNMRIALGTVLTRHTTTDAYTIDTNNLISELATTKAELIELNKFIDTILIALDGAITSASVTSATIDTYTITITNARNQVQANISSITSAISGINTAQKSLEVAKGNQNKILSTPRNEDVSSAQARLDTAEASVTTALGGHRSALSTLEKTRVRAHIQGKVSTLSIRRGDFVNTQNIGRIVGAGGEEVVFYIPTGDTTRVKQGMTIIISNSNIQGTIKSISTGTDSLTQQLEVHADLNGPSNLPNGSKVEITVVQQDNGAEDNINATMRIPMNAIKFDVEGSFVLIALTLNDDNSTILKALPITIGNVLNDTVEITGSDITQDTLIVTDARGLSDAQLVEVLQK